MKELIDRVRSFETDHAPDAWPAIRMREVSALADALADLQRELDNERARGIHTCHDDCTRDGCVNRRLREQLAAAQAKIDSLMLEYCPDEMTSEQVAEWAAHQEPTTIDAAMQAQQVACVAVEKGEKK